MVEAINTTDTKKSNFTNFLIPKKTNHIVAQIKTDTQNEIEGDKKNELAKSMSKLQVASLVIGTLASSVLIAYFSKNLVTWGKNRKLFKSIKKADIPDNVRKKLLLEYNKLKNADNAGSRIYINNVLRLNWKNPNQEIVDIDNARKILDNELVGLDNIKEEIISHLIKVQNYSVKNGIDNNGPNIICLVGPPGVAKTSIAELIAKAMDKSFGRMSLGGVSQSSFIKGSERVYKDSEPGQIIKLLQDAHSSDPVILIDELEKAGESKENGSVLSSLLDVLEPKQCKQFTDKYLEVPYDLSNVTFIITSNNLDSIPNALKNRLSLIHLNRYTRAMKTDICKSNITKLMEHWKIDASKVYFNQVGIDEIVNKTDDEGARKTLDNLNQVFKHIIATMETNGNDKKIIVDRHFVTEALKNKN